MRLILIEQLGSSDCDVITLVKFLSVGLLLVNCRLTVGILPADSWPTVYRQFRGPVLHFYRLSLRHSSRGFHARSDMHTPLAGDYTIAIFNPEVFGLHDFVQE